MFYLKDKVEGLQLLNNTRAGVSASGHGDDVVVNCYIIGLGKTQTSTFGIWITDSSGAQVRSNQISECGIGIRSQSDSGSAFIHNYVANSGIGLALSDADFYQGNVVTNCRMAFVGGKAIGSENGGD